MLDLSVGLMLVLEDRDLLELLVAVDALRIVGLQSQFHCASQAGGLVLAFPHTEVVRFLATDQTGKSHLYIL